MSVVDRIFTRLGVSDNLLEVKSTLLIELENLLNSVKLGTKSSLVPIYKLDRDTSTSNYV